MLATIFHLKLQSLIHNIRGGCFSTVKAEVWVTQYQKRGLPHAHMLFWLTNKDAFLSPDDVNEIISAQIPDR